MTPELREKLKAVSVATLATALYKRGLRNQVVQGVGPVAAKGQNMVGPAFTLRYMPAREDRNQLVEFRNPEHPQPRGPCAGNGQPQRCACRQCRGYPHHPSDDARRGGGGDRWRAA